MGRRSAYFLAIACAIGAASGFGACQDSNAQTTPGPQDLAAGIIGEVFADVPLPADAAALAADAAQVASPPAQPAVAPPAPAPEPPPSPQAAEPVPAPRGVAPAPDPEPQPARYQPPRAQYRPPSGAGEPDQPGVAAPAEGAPAPAVAPRRRSTILDDCAARGCGDVASRVVNSVLEFVGRYQTLLAWYQPTLEPEVPDASVLLEVPGLDALPVPVAVAVAPDSPPRLIPGLDHQRSGLPYAAELEPTSVRTDTPAVAPVAVPGRVPEVRDRAPRSSTWRAPAVEAGVARSAPQRARAPTIRRPAPASRGPAPADAPLDSPLSGVPPPAGSGSGSAGSAGGWSGGTGTAVILLLFLFASALLDLLRRLRLELAQPRSEHIASFPERPG
jgi:hypothetical protein